MESLNDVLTAISADINSKGEKKLNRWSRESFNRLINAAAADPSFSSQIAKIEKGEFKGYEEIACGKEFRKWCKKLIERAGIDPLEAAVVESADFPMGDISWMYEFFSEVLWLYLENNKFKLPNKEGFEATLALKEVPESKKVGEVIKPGGEKLPGMYETVKGEHLELTVKSKCPKWLQKRRVYNDK